MLFCETHDLVWEIISVSEKRMKNCIVKIINNVFEKNDKGGLFPLRVPIKKLSVESQGDATTHPLPAVRKNNSDGGMARNKE